METVIKTITCDTLNHARSVSIVHVTCFEVPWYSGFMKSTISFYPFLSPDFVKCFSPARRGVCGEFHPCRQCHNSLKFMTLPMRLSQAWRQDSWLWKAWIPLRPCTCSFSISLHLWVCQEIQLAFLVTGAPHPGKGRVLEWNLSSNTKPDANMPSAFAKEAACTTKAQSLPPNPRGKHTLQPKTQLLTFERSGAEEGNWKTHKCSGEFWAL